MIKGAIFDLDGTLIDSMYIWDTLAEDYLKSLGITAPKNLNEIFKSFTLEESCRYYQEHFGVSLSVDEIKSGINIMISDYYKKTLQLKPFIKEFLDFLKEKNVKMCIATLTDKELTQVCLKRLGVLEYFDGIFTPEDTGSGKETPDLYRKALNKLGINKSETIVFEDSLYALKTAKKDGFLTVAVYDSSEKNQKELKKTADFYITDFSKEQLSLIKRRITDENSIDNSRK